MKKLIILIVSTLFISSVYAQAPTSGLDAWYPFNTNALDGSTNGYNGTVNGATLTTDRFGNLNSAFDFSTAGYIDCNNVLNGTFAGAGKKFTISVWVKPSGTNNNNFIIAKLADAGCSVNERQLFIRELNNTVNVEYFGTVAGTQGRFVCGGTALNNYSKWYHIVVTYDGTINTNDGLDRVKIYLDNVMETTSLSCRSQSGSFPFDIPTGPAHFGIGNYLNSSGVPCLTATRYNGKIDDIRIYNRILTSTEITQVYNDQVGISSIEKLNIFEVYPNPASDNFTIELSGLTKTSELQIKNILGQTVYNEPIYMSSNNSIKQIETNNFSKGIYFVQIISENTIIATKKILVE